MATNNERFQPFEHTPIYKDSHALLKQAQCITASMNRAYKYTAGTRLLDAALDLSTSIAEAYLIKEAPLKLEAVKKIVAFAHKVLIMLRLVYDLQLARRPVYVECVTHCVDIIKQAQGWQNTLVKSEPRQNQDAPHQSPCQEL